MVAIYGRVVERFTRRPVSGAAVRIADSTAYTDANGQFTVESPTGNYQLVVSHPQYRASQRNLALKLPTNMIGEILIDSEVRAL